MQNSTAIVIVSYKTPWHLKQCLKSVFKYTQNFCIYLVHNSQDSISYKVGEYFEKRYPEKIKIYKNKENLGLTGGVNTCYVDAIKHKRICLLNSDTIVTMNWLKILNDEMDSNPKISQIMPDCNSFYPDTFLWKIIKRLPFGLNRAQILQNILKLSPKSKVTESFKDSAHFYDFCGGFCTLFNSDPIKQRGYILDPQIAHGYWDDLELSTYLRNFGEIGITTCSYVFHFGGKSFKLLKDINSDNKIQLAYLNGLYVCRKYEKTFLSEINKIEPNELIFVSRKVEVVKLIILYFGLLTNTAISKINFEVEAQNIWKTLRK